MSPKTPAGACGAPPPPPGAAQQREKRRELMFMRVTPMCLSGVESRKAALGGDGAEQVRVFLAALEAEGGVVQHLLVLVAGLLHLQPVQPRPQPHQLLRQALVQSLHFPLRGEKGIGTERDRLWINCPGSAGGAWPGHKPSGDQPGINPGTGTAQLCCLCHPRSSRRGVTSADPPTRPRPPVLCGGSGRAVAPQSHRKSWKNPRTTSKAGRGAQLPLRPERPDPAMPHQLGHGRVL